MNAKAQRQEFEKFKEQQANHYKQEQEYLLQQQQQKNDKELAQLEFAQSSLEAEVHAMGQQLQDREEQIATLNNELQLMAVYKKKSTQLDDLKQVLQDAKFRE